MNELLIAFLQNSPQTGQAGQPSMLPTIIMLVVLFAIVYFFMIRPQNKKQKEIQKFRNALQPGQDVVTIGGIHGTIKTVDDTDHTVMLEVASGVKIKFEKSAIMPNAAAAQQR